MPTKVTVTRKLDLNLGTSSRVLNPGEHLLSDEEMSLWFMGGLLASGAIVIVNDAEVKQATLEYKEVPKVFQSESGPVVIDEEKPEEKTDEEEAVEEGEEEKETKPKKVLRRTK